MIRCDTDDPEEGITANLHNVDIILDGTISGVLWEAMVGAVEASRLWSQVRKAEMAEKASQLADALGRTVEYIDIAWCIRFLTYVVPLIVEEGAENKESFDVCTAQLQSLRCARGQVGTGRDGTGRTGQDGKGRDGTGRDGTGRDGRDGADCQKWASE